MPVLRMVYISTVRSLLDYSAPVLSVIGAGRMAILEKIQNEAMRIILGCQKNTMVEVMRNELNLPRIQDRVTQTNIKNAHNLIRSGRGEEIRLELVNSAPACTDYLRQLKETILLSHVQDHFTVLQRGERGCPPWEDEPLAVRKEPLVAKKK